MLGEQPNTYGRWESDRLMPHRKIAAFCRATGIDPASLFGGNEPPKHAGINEPAGQYATDMRRITRKLSNVDPAFRALLEKQIDYYLGTRDPL